MTAARRRDNLNHMTVSDAGMAAISGTSGVVVSSPRTIWSEMMARAPGTRVPLIQGMVQPACFIGSRWSWHPHSLPSAKKQINESCPL